DWQYWEGRLLCVRRAVRLDERRVELCLLAINNTDAQRAFQLPEPLFQWQLRIDSADPKGSDLPVEQPKLDVPAQSVLLLSASVEAPGMDTAVHSIEASALQPDKAPRPTAPSATPGP